MVITTAFVLALTILFGLWFIENRRRKKHPVQEGINSDVVLPHTHEFELYHNSLSLCSMKTRVCMAELGIDYRSHHIDLIETGKYQNLSREFLVVNPAGTVPVLVHNGHPIYESHYQIRYAAEHGEEGQQNLVPTNFDKRSEMQYWVDQSSLIGDPTKGGPTTAGMAIPALTLPLFSAMVKEIPYHKIAEGLLYHFDKRRPLIFIVLKLAGLKRLSSLKPIVQAHKSSIEAMHRHLDDFEAQLISSKGPWILGDEFTLADVSWLVIFERLEQVDSLRLFLDEQMRPASSQYWQRLKQRPSYDLAIKQHSHPIVVRGTDSIIQQKAKYASLAQALDA